MIVAIYARVSTSDQSCEMQPHELRQYVQKQKWQVFHTTATLANAAVRVEKTEYKGWPTCYRVSNGEIELVVTGDVGPRVIRFGFIGGPNFFKEFPEQLGKSGEEKFQLRGGDRVWKAPEDPVATWAPDNVPVEIRPTSTGIIARAPVEPLTKLQKETKSAWRPMARL